MEREAFGLAAFRGDEIDVRVAIVFAGESDPLAIWREFGIKLVADVRSEAPGRTAFPRSDP
jgi:hypothetical protein